MPYAKAPHLFEVRRFSFKSRSRSLGCSANPQRQETRSISDYFTRVSVFLSVWSIDLPPSDFMSITVFSS
jgi:hypothetical protein